MILQLWLTKGVDPALVDVHSVRIIAHETKHSQKAKLAKTKKVKHYKPIT